MDTATSLEIAGDTRVVHCEGTDLEARSVIVACGSALRSLGIPGEEQFLGRGVSHCASCDAPFYVGKHVAVVGGGDSAVDEAAVLAAQVSQVTVIHRGDAFSAQHAAVEKLGSFSNVETVFGTELSEIRGSDAVTGIAVQSNGSSRELDVSGVFVFVGLEPNTAWLRDTLELDPAGHIVTDLHLQTSAQGVFAAGDIRAASAGLLAAVAGDGATAAVSAHRYLKGRT
jgi:thioredoxin reductase (NADPH)